MKKFRKITAFLLVLALSVIMLASCGGNESDIVATYNGNMHIYEDDTDFSDFYNLNRYFYAYEKGDEASGTSEYNTILSNAVKETIIVRVFETEMTERKYDFNMDAVMIEAKNDAATFDSFYEGGFKGFCEDWGVSENVFVLYNKYEAMKEIAKSFVEVEISESEAKKYYNQNPEKYFKKPHYDVSTIYLQVIDPSNKEEMEEAYNDAMLYIASLNNGRTWESVKDTAFLKYNEKNGMIFTEHLTCLNHISFESSMDESALEDRIFNIQSKFLAENGMTFEEMFPAGFHNYAIENNLKSETKEFSEAFEIYMNYASDIFNVEFEYAVRTYWQEGKTYSKPIYHAAYDSYVIVTFTRIEEEDVTITFEEAKESIVEILTELEKEKEVENYISERMSELKVQIEYK